MSEHYQRYYCWTCDRHTMHEDRVCLEHSREDEFEDEEAEEDRRVNEDDSYYLRWRWNYVRGRLA